MPTLRAGQRVIIVRRVMSGQDEYHNDEYVDVEIPVDGCAISAGFGTENIQGTQSTETNVTVHLPTGTVVNATDALRTPDGVVYEVLGTPNTWQSPFTGTTSMVEVRARVTTGGGPAV